MFEGRGWFPGLWTTGAIRSSSEAVKAPDVVKIKKRETQGLLSVGQLV